MPPMSGIGPADMPLIPYIYADLQKLIKTPSLSSLLQQMVLLNVKLYLKWIFLIRIISIKGVKCIQVSKQKELKSPLQKDLIILYRVSQLKKDACLFITKLLRKLSERTPLNSSMLCNSVVLNPLNIIKESVENNCKKRKYLGWIQKLSVQHLKKRFCCNIVTLLMTLAQLQNKNLLYST